MVIGWLATVLLAASVSEVAWAVDESPVEAAPIEDDVFDEEIVVEGELRVLQARRAVEHELKMRGYQPEKRKKNYILFRHPADWKGEIRLYNDGWVRMKRQPIQFTVPQIPQLGKAAPIGAFLCVVAPHACVKYRGQTVSKRKFMGQKVRTMDGLRPQVEAYASAVSDFETNKRISDLPQRLESLWLGGVPLKRGSVELTSPQDKKAALLRFWESRTENRWGMQVRATVEIFIREVVQYSNTPYTSEEIQRFNATRKCETALDLGRSWEALESAANPKSSER